MALTIEINEDIHGKYLQAKDVRYSMKLRLYLQDVGYWLNNPTQQRWGVFSRSNSIHQEDIEKIRKYIMDKKFLLAVGIVKRMYCGSERLKGYPINMLLEHIKRTKIKSIYGDKLLGIVNSKKGKEKTNGKIESCC